MKVLLIIIAILLISVIIMFLVIRALNRQIKSKDNQISNLILEGKSKDNQIANLMEENEIEKRNNKELAKKLADISCMSIDDVLHQLQHNKSDRKDNNLHS